MQLERVLPSLSKYARILIGDIISHVSTKPLSLERIENYQIDEEGQGVILYPNPKRKNTSLDPALIEETLEIFPDITNRIFIMSLQPGQTTPIVRLAPGTVSCVFPVCLPLPNNNIGYWTELARSVFHFKANTWAVIDSRARHMFLNHSKGTAIFIVVELSW